jgi:exopolysaccharide biosynthesis polyprenyl glycosylphosphotransferase
MPSFRRRLLLYLLKLSDVVILTSSLLFTSWFVTSEMHYMTLDDFLSLRLRVVNFIGIVGMLFCWYALFRSFHLYRSRRLDNGLHEWKDILKVTTLGIMIFSVAGHVFNVTAFTPKFIVTLWVISTSLTIVFRIIVRAVLRKVRSYGRNLRFVLIVGTNKRAYDFAHMIESEKELGYSLVGYLDRNIYRKKDDINLLGSLDDFPAVLEKYIIDEVVIALPIKSYYEEIQAVVQKAEAQGIMIRFLSQLFDTSVAKSRAELFENFSVLTMSSGLQDGWQSMVKRGIDVALASSLLIVTLPLIVFAIIAITIDSPGPVFFIQKRIGYNKRIFSLYKFRTMVAGAEDMQAELETRNEMDGPVFKIMNDPRITRVGKWLRKVSIDELPQLLNVLRGDMSLVGPRPLPVRDYSGFDKDWQRRRFSVLPGITCTWQINGRNNISFEDWMKMDMEYIDNWKLVSDIKILFKTIPAVLKGKGAA